MQFIDTNVFLRFLTKDDPKKAASCRKLIQRAAEGELKLYTTDLVIAELIWVLQSPKTYNLKPSEIFEIIMPLLMIKNLYFPCKKVFPDIMELFITENIDFIDAYNSEIMRDRKIETIYSYDKHFDQLPDIVRQEP
ncbi:MAG: PIN domain-containing protein [Bacillota bacterium]|nr:PIN domain-containing protein [Bacillota bacterium]